MWPFFLERTVTLRKRICGPISKVNEIVQHPESFSRLQPLVTRVDQDPANPQRYKITEHLHAPAHLWEYDNAFHATFTPKEDEDGRGVNVLVELPQSFLVPKFETKVRAKETTESGVVEVSEILQVRMLCILVPYVVTTMTKAHESLLDRLKAKVEAEDEGGSS